MTTDHRYITFQNALVKARHASKLTQNDVATRIGKPQSYVSKYESGERRLDVIEFLDLCHVLNIHPNNIFNELDRNNG